jgi:drug/metabolite transporter (DMT)-like permease
MIALALAVVCTTCFSLIVRHTQRAGQDQLAVMGLNYAAAAATALLLTRGHHIAPQTWLIGLLGGCTYVTAYLLFIPSLDLKGVAIANAVTRLSVLIPVLGAILIFGEKPRAIEAAGALLAMSAMPLLSLDRGFDGTRLTRRQVPLLLGLFLVNGICLFVNKWFHTTGLSAERPQFLGLLFGTAAVVSLAVWGLWSRRGGWRELATGVPLGVINFGTSFMIIAALDSLPGTIVFPVTAALGLVLTTGAAAWFWREIPGRLGRAGLVVALAAVVLINL